MAKIVGFTQKIFGSGAGVDQISKFGSLFAGAPAFTTSADEAQSLSNFLTGWYEAAIGGNSPAIEDMNAAFFVLATQLAYIQQAGICEWLTTKTYYTGSLVNVAGIIYVSIADDNTGNLVTDATKWTKVGGKVMTDIGDILYGGALGALTRLEGNTTTTKQFLTQTGTGSASAAPAWQNFLPSTIQKFTSGSGTYTRPAGVLYIRVRMVGGGGGGGGGGTSATATSGSDGANSTFGSLTANGGGGASLGGGSGGPASGGDLNITGGFGCGGQALVTNFCGGGVGGTSYFGGGGRSTPNTSGGTASTNSGSGGGGGGSSNAVGLHYGQGGGGSGGYCEKIISSPASTYSYSVGIGGGGGSAGTDGFAGGNGAAGLIIVEEYYQ